MHSFYLYFHTGHPLVYPDYRFSGPAGYTGVSTAANSLPRYPQAPLAHHSTYQYVSAHQGGTAIHPRVYTQYTGPVQV